MKKLLLGLIFLASMQSLQASELVLSHESFSLVNKNNLETVRCSDIKYSSLDMLSGARGGPCHVANLPMCNHDRVLELQVNGEGEDLSPGERVLVKCSD